MRSAIYTGMVRHQRFSPKQHSFIYTVFMLYLDLDEIPTLFDKTPFWSARRWALARFKREDYLAGNPDLKTEVLNQVEAQTGQRPEGAVCLLTNLRYFGYLINPISIYYCFDEQERLQAMLAEVTNTPWGERVSYVLPCEPDKKTQKIVFEKSMHVSPFHPMDMQYKWLSNKPNKKLALHLANMQADECVFDATLALKREPLTPSRLLKILIRFPFMTVKVAVAIHWQAVRLFFKAVPLHPHPKSLRSKA